MMFTMLHVETVNPDPLRCAAKQDDSKILPTCRVPGTVSLPGGTVSLFSEKTKYIKAQGLNRMFM